MHEDTWSRNWQAAHEKKERAKMEEKHKQRKLVIQMDTGRYYSTDELFFETAEEMWEAAEKIRDFIWAMKKRQEQEEWAADGE